MSSGEITEHRVDDNLSQFGGRDHVLAYMAVNLFCSCNPGRACKMLQGRGCRSNSLTPLFRAPSFGTVRFRNDSDLCILSAIFNAIHLLGNLELASKYWRHFEANAARFARTRDLPCRIRDFRDAQKHLHRENVGSRQVRSGPATHKLVSSAVLRVPAGGVSPSVERELAR